VVLKGSGDYSAETLAITKPMQRLESKIDHLEKSLVKNPMSKSNAAGLIGRTLGNFAGQGDLGELAGTSLAKFFGHGDYTVHSNSLMGVKKGSVVPSFAKVSRGTRYTEREFIGDIRSGVLSGGSTSFNLQTFDINPTNGNLFPWLSRSAVLYDQWEPHGIVFEFVSSSSEFNGTSQALGTVIMATDYDPYDPPFPDKQTMENSDYACSTKPSNGLMHGVECEPAERPTTLLFTKSENAPLTSTSLGNFGVATKGCSQGNTTLGELWVSYDITFYKKQLAASSIPVLTFIVASGTTNPSGGYFQAPVVLRSLALTITQNIGIGSVLNFNNSLLIGSRHMISYRLTTNTNSSDDFDDWTFANCTKVAQRTTYNEPGESQTDLIVELSAPGATVTTSLRPSGATATSYALSVTQTPDDYFYF
jgi:hypothetical protein